MSSKTYKEYNVHVADQFVESIDEAANTRYYLFASKHRDYTESSTPAPSSTISNSVHQTYDEMLFGKLITSSDVSLGIVKRLWANNTVYAAYDDTAANLDANNYFVYTSEGSDYHVWKCIDNNGAANSNSTPLFSDVSASLDTLYIKSATDGYQWKFMYTIPGATYDKFSSNTYIPVVSHANAVSNAINGSIDAYVVSNSGNNYNEYVSGSVVSSTNTTVFKITSGTAPSGNNDFYNNCMIYFTGGVGNGEFKQITDYDGSTKTVTVNTAVSSAPDGTSTYEISPLVRIKGDGSNAAARAIINTSTNTISNVEILQRGAGYTHADVTIEANNMASANLAAARAVIGPYGGHASNPKEELNAQYIIISTSFANNESSQIQTDNDLRTVGVIKDPHYANVMVTFEDQSANFTTGETVTLSTENASGVITFSNTTIMRLTNAVGNFVNSGNVTGVTSEATALVKGIRVNAEDDARSNTSYFQQTAKYGHNLLSGNPFTEDETVTDTINNANAFVYASNSTVSSLTRVRGTFDISNTDIVTGGSSSETVRFKSKISPDLVRNSGSIILLKNIESVSRSNTNTETIKLVFKF